MELNNTLQNATAESKHPEFSEFYDTSLEFTIFDSLLSFPIMTVDVIIIIVLRRFSILKTKRNSLVLSWAVTNLILSLTAPNKYVLVFYAAGTHVINVYYIPIYNVYVLSEVYQILYVLMLFVDSFYKNVSYELLTKLLRSTWASYVIFAILGLVIGVLNHTNVTLFLFLFIVMSFLLMATFIVKMLIYLVYAVRQNALKLQLRFLLVSGYVVGSFVWMIFSFVSAFVDTHHGFLFAATGDVFLVISNCTPLIQILLLYFYDNDFRSCLEKLLVPRKVENAVRFNNTSDNTNNTTNGEYILIT